MSMNQIPLIDAREYRLTPEPEKPKAEPKRQYIVRVTHNEDKHRKYRPVFYLMNRGEEGTPELTDDQNKATVFNGTVDAFVATSFLHIVFAPYDFEVIEA